MKILIVDDEQPSRRMFRMALDSQHEVHEATDGASALEVMLAQGAFEVVLLDLKMPGMSGLELLSKIHKRWPDTAVIIITAYSSLAVAAEAMRAGARHFLSKPTEPQTLRAAVAAARRRAPSEIQDVAEDAVRTHHDLAVTLNGFTVEPTGEPAQLNSDGSAVHRFRVSHTLESWKKVIAVRIGEHAFLHTAHRDVATASRLAALVARRALAEHLWREGLLPSHDELTIDDIDTAHLMEAQLTAAET